MQKSKIEAAPVKIAAVTTESIPVQVTAIGSVEPYSTIQVKAQVSGALTDVQFGQGDVVKEGQVLFTIDTRPFDVALQQAEANLSKAEALVDQAKAATNRDKAQATNAKTQFQRNAELLKKGFVSKEDYDTSKSNAEALEAAVGADEANTKSAMEAIRVAKASIEDAKLQLNYCTIRSPIDGKTGSLLVNKGNLVKANDVSPLVIINQMTPIYVTFSVPEKYLSDIKKFMAQGPLEVKATIPNEEANPIAGKLTFIDNTVSQNNTATIKLKASFENADNRLWPGQYVNVAMKMTVLANAVVVPSQAVQPGQNGQYVYVVTKDMTAELRKVVTGESFNGKTVIKEGLEPEETVVTDGQLRVIPKGQVRIADAPATGQPAAAGPQDTSAPAPDKDKK
jgi:multidrug efflux system membrane fusion protein